LQFVRFFGAMAEVTIGTHSGSFHCDEALACFFLRQTNRFRNSNIVRSRNQNVLDSLSILVDVGSIYDPASLRFDHHQSSFKETFSPKYNIKLSSAGLIYLHFGKEVLSNLTGIQNPTQIDFLHTKVYDEFVLSIDAIDNGVDIADEVRYRIRTDLSSRVGRLNPSWTDPSPDYDSRFQKAVVLVGEEFNSYLSGIVEDWLPARVIVEKAMEEENRMGIEKNILFFSQALPWREHLLSIEQEQGMEGKIQFVIFPGEAGTYRIQGVPAKLGSFSLRTALAEPWRGLRDDVLSTTSGIDGCVFVHASGFIGGNRTVEGALQMALRTLEFAQK